MKMVLRVSMFHSIVWELLLHGTVDQGIWGFV